MVTDAEVLSFFQEELSLPVSLSGKADVLELDTTLQDYAEDDELFYAIEKYSDVFHVDISDFDWGSYYPWRTQWFFRKWFSKSPLKQDKPPLTVRMFAESAKAGRWLYD